MHAVLLAAVALAAAVILLRFKELLGALGARRRVLIRVGRDALDEQPESIRLARRDGEGFDLSPAGRDLVAGLRALGYADCGLYDADALPGFKIRVLVLAAESSAAFVYEHPRAGAWMELNTRYEDGSTATAVSRAATGQPEPPFFRRLVSDPKATPESLYRRLMDARPKAGIKPVSAESVVPDFEDAYRRIVAWRKQAGMTASQVAASARSVRKDRPGG